MSTIIRKNYPAWSVKAKIVERVYKEDWDPRLYQHVEYMKPMTGSMPMAEKIKCCALQDSMFHFIKCFDLEN